MERCDKCKSWTRDGPGKAWGKCSANKWASLANEFCNAFKSNEATKPETSASQ